MRILCSIIVACLGLASCRSLAREKVVEPDEAGIRAMLAALQDDLEARGPEAWMDYFADDPAFFMASEGRLLFADRAAAQAMVDAFDPEVSHMQLWLDDVRIEPLDAQRAMVAAAYREVILDVDGNELPMRGYLTGIVQLMEDGWAFRNLHWSSPLADD